MKDAHADLYEHGIDHLLFVVLSCLIVECFRDKTLVLHASTKPGVTFDVKKTLQRHFRQNWVRELFDRRYYPS